VGCGSSPRWGINAKERKMADWRNTLKRLIKTPAVMGVWLKQSPIEMRTEELVGSYNAYLKQQIQVHCDPDVLEQTARKNSELMETLAEINAKLERGDLIEVKHGHWIEHDDNYVGEYYTCSACKCDWTTIDGTPEENFMRFCPECGAKMDEPFERSNENAE
jgi:hypothetical protein